MLFSGGCVIFIFYLWESKIVKAKINEAHYILKGKMVESCGWDLPVTTLDIAKRLLDYGFHPFTIYFPLIVPGAMMIEPTETESKETLDEFINVMNTIIREARENPELLRQAPVQTPVRRLDETLAARKPVLKWRRGENI